MTRGKFKMSAARPFFSLVYLAIFQQVFFVAQSYSHLSWLVFVLFNIVVFCAAGVQFRGRLEGSSMMRGSGALSQGTDPTSDDLENDVEEPSKPVQ